MFPTLVSVLLLRHNSQKQKFVQNRPCFQWSRGVFLVRPILEAAGRTWPGGLDAIPSSSISSHNHNSKCFEVEQGICIGSRVFILIMNPLFRQQFHFSHIFPHQPRNTILSAWSQMSQFCSKASPHSNAGGSRPPSENYATASNAWKWFPTFP